MSVLMALQQQKNLFLDKISQKPTGRYAHLVLVRETESFPLFQTDGSLNTIRVRAGVDNPETVARLLMFKRKQTSPERLNGRELLRFYELIDSKKENVCDYNSDKFCKKCPDCILYGFAIGDQGAEKSKVYIDSAYSLSTYEQSHKAFSFNGLYEHGTMTQAGKTRSSFGEQDHVAPQVFFPAVVTLRDPTYNSLMYILGNIFHTHSYGAQTSRTGRVYNHLLAVTITNGEIFSNLRLTQKTFDSLSDEAKQMEPLSRESVLTAAQTAYTELISQEAVVRLTEIADNEVNNLRDEVTRLYSNKEEAEKLLKALYQETERYAKETQKPKN